MPLTSGTRFGSYEIAASLGAGGMGEVYRAHDTNLKRDVTIKVLPAALGPPEPLFVPRMGPVVPAVARQWYVPSPDGQRFLMSVLDGSTASPLEVILNFDGAARR
jgi:serine/threonine protein kinase